MKAKLNSLKVAQLNELLRERNLPQSGNKADKIAALMALCGSDEVEIDDNESQDDFRGFDEAETNENSMQRQMAELRSVVMSLAQSVQQLTVNSGRSEGTTSRTHVQNCGSLPPSGNQATTTNTSGCLKDYIVMLPDFDPINQTVTSTQFIDKIEKLRQMHAWSDQTSLFAVHHKMKGVAKMWIDALPIVTTWEEFKRVFFKDFPCRVSIADIHRELMSRRRTPGESLVQYYYSMLAIGRKGDIDDQSIVSYVINGLNDNGLTRTLLAMNLQTCNELLRSLEGLPTTTVVMRKVQQSGDDEGRNVNVTSGARSKGPKCFNCNNFGHISTNCPQPQRRLKCTSCSKVGHEASQCKSKGTNVAAMSGDPSVESCPPVMKEVTINKEKFLGFVDTGSDFTLIKESAVPVNANCKPTLKRMKGFGGSVIEAKGMVECDIMIDEDLTKVSIFVVPDELMPYDVLLGRDVLCKQDKRLTIEYGILKVEAAETNKFDIGEDIGEGHKDTLNNLLMSHKECFAENLEDLGRCKNTCMEISVSTDTPVVGKRYQVPFSQRQTLSDIIDKLLRCGIIRQSNSPYAASVLLVKKSNGESRMCTDFRALNAVTIKKQYSMPVAEEQLSLLAGNKYFTTLDMTSGYYQIPIKEECKKYTAFITPEGLYEYNVMPFGLTNAPMVFQEMITQIIRRLDHRKNIVSYVDEVIIPSKTVEDGIQVLTEFLATVQEEGLTLRPTKCSFMRKTVNFLGHIISSEGISPGEEKTKCIKEFPRPGNVSDVRRFLGITNFFRKFVHNYSHIAMPLTRLLKKDVQFSWQAEQEEAFEVLKSKITSQPLLTLFDPGKEHEVHTDASAIGLSGILFQADGEGTVLRPVFYYSRRCSEAESQYTSHELEVLAIVETVERFRIYLLGKLFRIVTDCNAVATTKATTPLPPRIARWWFKLQEFDYTMVHRSGAKMTHVDGMSRSPTLPPIETETVADKVLVINANVNDWLYQLQMSDAKLRNIAKVLSGCSAADDGECAQIRTDYFMENGRLFRKIGDLKRMVIPEKVRWRITKACHDDVGHFSIEKTLNRLQKDFWFPRMRRYVKSYISSCPECCYRKVKGGKPEGELHVEEIIPIPFRSINIDHLGPFPKSKRGFLYVLVIVCSFTKYTIIKPTRNTKTTPVITALQEVMSIFGQPRRIVSDKGTAFTSVEFQRFIEVNGIQHIQTAVRTPRANGQAERANQTFLNALRCLTDENKEWDSKIPTIQWSINSQPNSTSKFTPNELIFNFNPRDVSCNRIIQALSDEPNLEGTLQDKREQAAANINAQREKWKLRYDTRHVKPTQYKEGDLVVIDCVPQATGQSHKLDPKYKGPYIITRTLGNDRYLVEDLPDLSLTQRRYCNVMSNDHMKPWCYSSPDLDANSDEEDHPSRVDEESGEAELSTTVDSCH